MSDLGLTAFTGDNGVHAFVRSLATADPAANVAVKIVAKNNEVLAQAKTDGNGYVRFDQGLIKGEGGLAPAVLVAEGTGDYAFLDLSTAAFDLSDRGVKGRETATALDGFLYAERGVYRPGETVHLTGLVRDKAGQAANVPMTLIITRPDGVEHKRVALTSADIGGHAHDLALAPTAMTGTWKARLHADPKSDALATLSFLVEDFLPERLDLTLSSAGPTIAPEDTQTVTVSGRYLYGPPAANLALEADVVVKASARDLPGLEGYQFGQAGEKISPVRKNLEQLPSTDAKGAAGLAVILPAIPKTTKPLDADVQVKLREPGGRTIERTITLAVDPRAPRLGIKPLFSGSLGEGQAGGFDVVILNAEGKRTASKSVAWTLFKLESSWQWYNRDGSWTYDSVTLTRKVAAGSIDVGAEQPAKVTTASLPWGRYRLEVASTEAGGPLSSVVFSSGWYGGEAADTPEMLDVALDKPAYKAGDTAKLKIATRTGGKALVTVLGGGLYAHKLVDVPRGGGEIPVEVGANWGSGAYVTAMLYRATDEAQKRMPGRAVGLKWLAIDQASRTLKVSLDTPQKVASGATLVVPVKVDGLARGEEARVTLAAVDVGILNLTRYQTPSPEGWFYAQTRLGAEIRDLYGRLIDGMRAERGRLRSGGDAASGMAMQGTPPVDAIVALTSGIVKVDAEGRAKVEFALPDFNGTVRVMAVAWSKGQLGHAQSDVLVRDQIALTASLPRFLTLGDEARLAVDVHNVEGAAGPYKIAIKQQGGGASSLLPERTLTLGKEERFTLKPQDVGLYTWDVAVTGPGGIEVKRHLTLDVKPLAGDVKRVRVSKLTGNGGKLTLSADILADLVPGRTQVNVSVGPLASFDVPGLLSQLDRYPYGCAEQTTSRALPLLYANQLAVQVGLAKDSDLRERIQGAIERVLEMQDGSGAFGIWGPRNGDLWLTSYVMDFLTRAKESGFTVKPLAFTQGLDRLANFIAYAQDFEKGGEDRAYALYVLARNGRAPAGELRYYVDTRLDRFSTSLSKAQLGAALAMLGDKERAEKAFAAAIGEVQKKDSQGWRNDYGSSLRDGAALVALTSEARTAQQQAPQLANVLAKAFAERTYTSTQEQAWMLLAARALSEQAKDARLSVNGEAISGSLNRRFSPAEIRDGTITIANLGEREVDAVVSVIGVALTPEPAVSKGFTLERSYYTLDGQKVDLKSGSGGTSQLKQTDRLVTVVKIEATEQGGRVLLVDHLPAGLEIENPRLVDGGDIKALSWLKPTIKPEHTEFRDDRFVAAFNLSGKSSSAARGNDDDDDDDDTSSNTPTGPVSTATVAYIVRAVIPGSFVHPAATVEDMYRPERFARTAAGRLEVKD